MSRWGEAFAALSRDRDTVDTVRQSGGRASTMSQTVKSVAPRSAFSAPSSLPAPRDVPAPWTDGIRSVTCPADETPARFERARQGALRFAAEHAAEAMRLGWTHDELFALMKPFANFSRQGAAWLIRDSTVVAVSAAAITLRTASGATTRIYKKTLH